MNEQLNLKPLAVKTMFANSKAEIESIRTAAGFPKEQFDRIFLPLLFDYALNVQDMPLSKDWYHKPGGAWAFGLFISVVTLRVSADRIFFSELDSRERGTLERQCRFGAFAAGLASGIAILAESAKIADQSGAEFHPLTATNTLFDWLTDAKGVTFNWRPKGEKVTKPECTAIAARFLRPSIMGMFDLRVVRLTYSAVYPQSAPNATESLLAKAIRESIDATRERYCKKFFEFYDNEEKATPLPTALEAAALGKDLAEEGVHRELANPLDDADDGPATATTTVDPSTGEITVVSAKPAPAAPAQPPKLTAVAGTAASATVSPAPAAPRPAPARPMSVQRTPDHEEEEVEPEVTHLTLLADAAPELQDWFKALRHHERYDRLKEKLKITEDGIEVPATMIGALGLDGQTVLKFMRDANMVIKNSKDLQSVFLHKALQPLFFDTL